MLMGEWHLEDKNKSYKSCVFRTHKPYALSFPEKNSAIQCIYWIKPRGGILLFLWKNTVLKIFRCPLNFDLLYGSIALNLVFICEIFTLYKLAEFLINYIIYILTQNSIYI